MKTIAVLGLASLLLGGCAAMSEAECRTGDWYGAGEKDGRDGQKDRLADYAEACHKVGVLPNPGEYTRGRERGLLAYCSPANGYRVGRDGQSYRNVCAPELQDGFLREYEVGRARYELQRDIASLESDLQGWGRQIDRLNDQIGKAQSDDERNKLRRDRDSYERQRRDGQIRLTVLRARWLVQGD